jgi:hypothetical protein
MYGCLRIKFGHPSGDFCLNADCERRVSLINVIRDLASIFSRLHRSQDIQYLAGCRRHRSQFQLSLMRPVYSYQETCSENMRATTADSKSARVCTKSYACSPNTFLDRSRQVASWFDRSSRIMRFPGENALRCRRCCAKSMTWPGLNPKNGQDCRNRSSTGGSVLGLTTAILSECMSVD